MSGSSLHTTQIVLLLLLFSVIALGALARRLQTPYPIVMVIGGLLLGLIPGMPKVTLNPDVIFLVVLPPLLYFAAWNTSWAEFCRNLVSIAFLAVGLVAFTVVSVAQVGSLLIPGLDWRLGFCLGAVVATTDALAATSIAKRLSLPKRIVEILEGESLVNDSTGLLALEFATLMVVYGQTPTLGSAVLRLIYLSVAGAAIGAVLGRIVEWFEHRIDHGPIEIAISILVPYAAYLSAEVIHASGVLAVVACGLYLGRQSSHFFSPSVRLQANAVWSALNFTLNGFVFLMIGLQLPFVLFEIGTFRLPQLILDGLLFSAFLILIRLIWVYPGATVSFWVRTHLLHRKEEPPTPREVFVVGWTGMRGVIALAAAMSLPQTIADGSPFPNRSLIVFLTFCVILVTLVLQGLTLPPLIRFLKIAESPGGKCDESEARRLVLEAALRRLNEDRQNDQLEFAEVYSDLEQHYRTRMASLKCTPEGIPSGHSEQYTRFVDVSRELLDVERHTALQLRNDGRIGDDVLREIERELDLNVTRLSSAEDH